MVAKRSHDLEGIYYLEEPIFIVNETTDEESPQFILESEEVNSILRAQQSFYDFDECYSDESSSYSIDDEEDNSYYSSQNDSFNLRTLANMALQQESILSNSIFGELEDFEDNDSVPTFNSFANAYSRGVRKWRSNGSVRSLFSDTSFCLRSSVTSVGELSSEDGDEAEYQDILVELSSNL
jgi:hypothetical protein